MDDRQADELLAAIGELRFRIWFCPVRHPWPDEPTQTIEWDGDVATCLWRGCWRRSDDPMPRGECLCEGISDECTGQCCGPGQCSCSWPVDQQS